ncbi:MAG: DoxX family protein [Cyanobacteria bacterium P01_A01_bin.123]
MEMVGILAARILLTAVFIQSALNKILNSAGTQQFMESNGVPSVLLLPTIIVLVAGSLSVLLGYKARIGAWLLIGFLIPATLVFHTDFSDPMNQVQLMKNLGLMGGLLMIAIVGSGSLSIDGKTA